MHDALDNISCSFVTDTTGDIQDFAEMLVPSLFNL